MRLFAICFVLVLAACGDDTANNETTEPVQDAGDTTDIGAVPDAGIESDASTAMDSSTGTDPDMGDSETLQETEPNDGSTADEFNDLPVAAELSGVIGSGDSDIFRVPADPGQLYTVTLTLPDGSSLQPHITILDAGRDGDPAGDDYVKIVRSTTIQYLGMGQGGYLVVVRDARNVDGSTVGGDDFTYSLRVDGVDGTTAANGAVTFGMPLTGTLGGPGSVDLWTFEASEGTNVVFDMSSQADGRLYVYAAETGSWIARQDDRSLGDPNPLIDAPLFANGAMMLVVENIAEEVATVPYTIQTASN